MRVSLAGALVATHLCACGWFGPTDGSLSRDTSEPGAAAAPPPGDWIDAPRWRLLPPDLVAEAGVVIDRTTGLEWQRVHSGRYAVEQLDAACKDLVIDGKTGFRLPTRSELLSIVDLDVVDREAPALPKLLSEQVTSDGFFWTATPAVGLGGGRWIIGTHDGVAARGAEGMWLVRCVRGEPPANGPRFAIDGDFVRDLHTALRWRRAVEEDLHAVVDASARCAARGERLPSVYELQSIVDARRRSPAIDPVFGETPRETFWSASDNAKYAHYGWAVSFETGETVYANRESQFRVRCVQ
ncbi:MAG: DUF1566 domain-containing protein [Deltaproteobacteria bacterium]|nr:DUF1566 domain-containing protein [Deltaproteobacteria bacterium]